MYHECKRCLLLESGEGVTYKEIMEYVSTIPNDDIVDLEIFNKRIEHCRNCDNLISGMCRKCGCYVEVRARLKKADCPDYNNRKW